MEKIAVIEASVPGRVWAVVFAKAGFEVSLYDSSPDQGAETLRIIRDRVNELQCYGQLSDPADVVFARISIATTLEAAVEGAFHVQEAGTDTPEFKIEIFAKLDKIAAPDAVLASSTSTVFPSTFSENVPGRHRCIVVHPVQPPYGVRAIEVVPGQWTSPEVVERSRAQVERCGLVPIMIKREMAGYVINSLQIALACEAFRLVSEGVASPEDVEAVVREGLGPRWSFMGPFVNAGVNSPGGIAGAFNAQAAFYTKVRAAQTPVALTPELIGKVHEALSGILNPGNAEERREWRDRRLMALAQFQSSQPK